MPQNVVDTVLVTRLLRARFLWTDALGIIQDSKSNWEIEGGITDGPGLQKCTCDHSCLFSKSKPQWFASAKSVVDACRYTTFPY